MPACSSAARRRSTTLVAKLREHGLITLVGRSGSGKSSVVYAGLIPALRRRADGRTWAILSLRPGAEPLHALVRALRPAPARPAALRGRPSGSSSRSRSCAPTDGALGRRIRSLLATAEERGTDRLLLYVDQWEELYTQALRQPALDARAGRGRRRPLHRPPARRHPHQPLHGRPHRPRRLLRRPPEARAARRRRAAGPGQSRPHAPRGPRRRHPRAGRGGRPHRRPAAARDAAGRGLPRTSASCRCWNTRSRRPGSAAASGDAPHPQRLRPGRRHRRGRGQARQRDLRQPHEAEQAAARRLFVSLVTPGEGREDTRARASYPEQDDGHRAPSSTRSAPPRPASWSPATMRRRRRRRRAWSRSATRR